MNKASGNIAQKIIGGVFALAVVYFAAGIAIDKRTGPRRAQERFDVFAYETRALAAKHEPTDEAFRAAFAPLLAEHAGDFSALQLYVNNQLLFSYAAPADEGEAVIRVTENTKTLLGNNLEISGILRTNGAHALVAHAKVSFVLILFGTAAAVVLLLLAPQGTEKRGGDRGEHDDEADLPPLAQSRTAEDSVAADETIIRAKEEDAAFPAPHTPEQDEETEPAPQADEDGGIPADGDEAQDAHQSDAAEQTAREDTEFFPDEAEEASDSTADARDEHAEFDPIGEMEEDNRLSAEGRGMTSPEDAEDIAAPAASDEAEDEPDTITVALENELVDAIANGQDLSALIILLKGLGADSTSATQLKKLLTDRLGRQGIVGDHRGAIALIVKNTALDTALAFAQSLNGAISVILQRSGESAQTAIGIAARSFRMIGARQLLTEAEQAALHADGENPIVAFRANPEKYRQFLQEA